MTDGILIDAQGVRERLQRELQDDPSLSLNGWAHKAGLPESTVRTIIYGQTRRIDLAKLNALANARNKNYRHFVPEAAEGLAFAEPGSRGYDTSRTSAHSAQRTAPGQEARAYRLLLKERPKESGEQLELWAVQAAEAFARSGMKRLDENFIRSFLSQQED
jgi:hypothetical protein